MPHFHILGQSNFGVSVLLDTLIAIYPADEIEVLLPICRRKRILHWLLPLKRQVLFAGFTIFPGGRHSPVFLV